MKVLVTGASGFIGGYVASEFSKAGYEVVGVDKTKGDDVIQADITDYEALERVLSETKPETVVHLAAISGTTGKNEIEQSFRQPHLNFRVNTYGTANVCEVCRVTGVKSLIYMSTFAVYGKLDRDRLPITEGTPTSTHHAYATSKLMGEGIVRAYSEDFGIKSVIFRAPFIAGEFQKEMNVLREFIEASIADKELIIFGNGQHVREFIHPVDLAKAFIKAVGYLGRTEPRGELFVLGNKSVTMTELANMVIAKIGRGRIKYMNSDRSFDQYSDYSKARDLLEWIPDYTVDQIIDRILETEYSVKRG